MSPPQWDPIDDKLLHDIWMSDQAMYPAPKLTYDQLKNLADACPELSFSLRPVDLDTSSSSGPGDGLIIVWPLQGDTYWEQLLDQTIEEHDVKASMFPPSRRDHDSDRDEKTPVGLHVFHIERFPSFQRARRQGAGFTRLALHEVQQRIARLGRTQSWDIIGYSALVATPEGSSAFKQLGFCSPDSEQQSEQGGFCPRILKLDGNESFLPPV